MYDYFYIMNIIANFYFICTTENIFTEKNYVAEFKQNSIILLKNTNIRKTNKYISGN